MLIITVLTEGYNKIRAQSLPTRAPEVWRGLGYWPSSDVWSVGVTVSQTLITHNSQLTEKLAHWLSPTILFGAKDKMVQGPTEAWCVAKIRRLIGPLDPPVKPEYEEDFFIAEHLESSTFVHPDTKLETPFITSGTLRQELQRLSSPKVSLDLIDFIEYLLVLDHTKRPTAAEALQHPYLGLTLE
jgi:serine/threonine protein kinase